MSDPRKTVTSGSEILDPLYMKQQMDVEEMRSSLLSFSCGDPNSARNAVHRITVMRFYHQLSRIIRYTDMMDKIEAKLYESIDASLDKMNTSSPATWMTLVTLQEKLQKCMIESQKLLDPYLDMKTLAFTEVPSQEVESSDHSISILEQSSRDRLRQGAQEVLAALQSCDVEESGDTAEGSTGDVHD